MWRVLLLTLCCSLLGLEAFKILVYSPTISKSHMLSNARIANVLVDAGHNVTLLEAEYIVPSSALKNDIQANRIILSNITRNRFDPILRGMNEMFFSQNPGFWGSVVRDEIPFLVKVTESCDEMFQNYRDFFLSLREDKFDIFMTEQMDNCGPAIKHIVQAKSLIWISSTPLIEYMGTLLGVHAPPSFIPSAVTSYPDVSDDMTLYQRSRNILEHFNNHHIMDLYFERTDAVVQKHFGQDFPSVKAILQDLALIFVLADEFLSFPRPILHNMVYIGGSGMEAVKQELTEPYLSEMKKGAKGVVFFSMGSVTKTTLLPTVFKKNVIKAMSGLSDYHFLVKVDAGDTEFADLATTSNIKIVHWVPQPALLAHDRLKLFITHGGYNSLLETVHAGKPVILLPFFADQWTNGRLAERNKFGRVFNKRQLLESSEEFKSLLMDVLENPSLQEHVLRIRRLIQTKPTSGTQRLISYTQFVGENMELPELHVSGRKLSTVVYHNLDIIALVILALSAVVGVVIVVGIGIGRSLLKLSSIVLGPKILKKD